MHLSSRSLISTLKQTNTITHSFIDDNQIGREYMTYLLNTMGIRILKYIDILMSWCSAIPRADADMDIYIAKSIDTCLTSNSNQKMSLYGTIPRLYS